MERFFSIIAAVLAVACWTLKASAAESAPSCSFAAQLRGDNYYFLSFGYDAWQEQGLINCASDSSGDKNQGLPVTVRFETLAPGDGFTLSCPLSLSIDCFIAAQVPQLSGAFRLIDPQPGTAADSGSRRMFLESADNTAQSRFTVI